MNKGSSILIIGVVVAIIVVAIVGYNIYAPKLQLPTSSLSSLPAAPSPSPSQATSQQPTQPKPAAQATDATAGWKMYKNETYGFEFKYWPGFEQKSEDKKSVAFEQCDGAVKQYPNGTGPEGLAEVCQGVVRRLFAEVREQKFDPTHLADASEMRKPVKKISINGHDFYIARHEVYTYVGWDAQTPLNDNTLIFGFSGNGFVLQPTNNVSSKELEQIMQILETVKF